MSKSAPFLIIGYFNISTAGGDNLFVEKAPATTTIDGYEEIEILNYHPQSTAVRVLQALTGLRLFLNGTITPTVANSPIGGF